MTTQWLCRSYGAFVAAAGVWPIVNLRTFEAVTGPKVDGWLVKTVGLLLTGIGAVLVAGSRRETVPRELLDLGWMTAAGLSAIELYYGLRGRISKVYLADAVVETGATLAFARARLRARERRL